MDMKFIKNAEQIAEKLKQIPKFWDGKKATLEMKESGYRQWRQMEWIGFYFQYLCEKHLSEIMEIPGTRYGNVSFDGFRDFPCFYQFYFVYCNIKTIK